MIDIQKHIIYRSDSLKTALEKLNKVPENLTLFVLDNKQRLVGTLTDGDVRRRIIEGHKTEETVEAFMTTTFNFLNEGKYSIDEIRKIKKLGVKLLPILNPEGRISGTVDFNKVKTILPIEAIVMAGGRGERLRPLTDDTPKPLLKIGNKTILKHNIDLLQYYGINDFVISIKYLAEKFENYLMKEPFSRASIRLIKEDEPLGTIGAISLVDRFKYPDLLIVNSDILTNINYEDFYQTYLKEDADICIGTIPYNIDVPYAVLEIQNNNVVTALTEKPHYTMYANAGIYLINQKLVKDIPLAQRIDATDFIRKSIESGYKVIKYPILGYWIDIGNLIDYSKAQEYYKHLENDKK